MAWLNEPAALLQRQLDFLSEDRAGLIHADECEPGVFMDSRSERAASAQLERCMVGLNSRVAGDCVVRDAVIGNDCLIEKGARIENSLILDGSRIGAGTRIHSAIVCGGKLYSLKYRTSVVPGTGLLSSVSGNYQGVNV